MTQYIYVLTFVISFGAFSLPLESSDPIPITITDDLGIIQAAIKQVMHELKLVDEVEKKLFYYALKHTKGDATTDSITIVILRPSDSLKPSKQVFEFKNEDQQSSIKMVKVKTKNVTEPMGIIIDSGMKKDRLITKQLTLHYGKDKTWKKIAPMK